MRVYLSDHAIERYRERVRDLPLERVGRELRSLADQGTLEAELPWKIGQGEAAPDAYLVISDGVALALRKDGNHWLAVTTLVRDHYSPARRAARKKRRRRRRYSDLPGGRPMREEAA